MVVSRKLTPFLESLKVAGKVEHYGSDYESIHLDGAFLVIGATDEAGANERIFQDARKRGILVNIVDDHEKCDFILPSIVEQGSLQIAVSTGGRSPALARKLRRDLEAIYGSEYAALLEILGALRKKILAKGHPSAENKRHFEAVIQSDILELIRKGDREGVRRRLREATGVDLEDLEKYV